MKFPQNVFPLLIAYQIRIANNGAILFYSGNPGPGNLVGALSPKSGTDPFGNTYPQGYSLIMGGQQIVMGILGGNPLIYWVTGNSHILNSGAIQAFQESTGTGAWDLFQIIGPESTINDDMALIVFASSSDDGTTSKANLTLQYRDQALNFHAYERVDFAGVNVVAGSIAAVEPGTGTSSSNVAAAEVWHNMSLTASFTGVVGALPRYRKEADGGSTIVRLGGQIQTAVATGAGTTASTLATGYIPGIAQHMASAFKTAGGVNSAVAIGISTAAMVVLEEATAVGDITYLDGVTYVLN